MMFYMTDHPTDLTDKQWDIIKHNFDYGNFGKTHKYPRRDMVNAVFHVIRTGCRWKDLPKRYPNWPSVYEFYRTRSWNNKEFWTKLAKDVEQEV